MKEVKINKNQAGQRIDKFLHKCLPSAGTSFLYKMLRKKNIVLNGKKVEGKELIEEGDIVTFFFSDETFAKFSNTNQTQESEYNQAYHSLPDISIIYEDANMILLDKPVGVLTQKANINDLTLNEWLIGYLLNQKVLTEQELHTFHPSVCNRLDRNTSGLVICGKSLLGLQTLSKIIKERQIQKYYYTICVGELNEDAVIDGYLYKDPKSNKVTIYKNIPKKSVDIKPIKTAYHPLYVGNGYTLLEVELITGKTHQIRAHLASIKHPLIGDVKYGNRKTNQFFREKYGLENQLLHAHHIHFRSQYSFLSELKENVFMAACPKLFCTIAEDLFHLDQWDCL